MNLLEQGILYRCLKYQSTGTARRKANVKVPAKRRRDVFRRDGNICLKCGAKENLTIDHIVPVSKGGLSRMFNLQSLCSKCNGEKGDNIKCYRKI